jgi:S-adenosylmethionine hydrolase
MNTAPLIALLTDFSKQDPFCGIMKGVISKITPGIPLIDLNNEIPPGDIQRAAITLWQSRAYFPDRTVFLCVVDPGVGTNRCGVVVQTGEKTYIGPDNGIFTFILDKGYKAWELQNPKFFLPNPTHTFHGRDIFAPAAAYVSKGVPGSEFGREVQDLVVLPQPHLESTDKNTLQGEVLYADHFGNLLTSLGSFSFINEELIRFSPWLQNRDKTLVERTFNTEHIEIQIPLGAALSFVRTFFEAPPEGCAAIIGSSGLIEIIANQKSAAAILGLKAGDHITLSSRRHNLNG